MPRSEIPDAGEERPAAKVKIAGGDLDVREESGFYEAYSGFARSLRTWFIAYGIGAPVVLLTQDRVWGTLAASGFTRFIAYAIFAGVALQVISALIYKTAMWYLYMGELKRRSHGTKLYKISEWLSEAFWVEFVFDLLTSFLFGWATARIVGVFTV